MLEKFFKKKTKPLEPEKFEELAEPMIKLDEGLYRIGSTVFVRRGGKLDGPLDFGWKIRDIRDIVQDGGKMRVIDLVKKGDGEDTMYKSGIPLMNFRTNQMEGTILTKANARVFLDGEGAAKGDGIVYTVVGVIGDKISLFHLDPSGVQINTSMNLNEYLSSSRIVPAQSDK